MPTLHFAYTVPRAQSRIQRGIDRLIKASGLPPPYRYFPTLAPWKRPVRAPHSISYHLLKCLGQRWQLKYYSMQEHGVAQLAPGDIYLGAPFPKGGYTFEEPEFIVDPDSVTAQTFAGFPGPEYKKFLILPYADDVRLVGWVEELACAADGTILIGGQRWLDGWGTGAFSFLDRSKVLHVNMGLDIADYPRLKTRFNPAGKRKYLYIGHTGWYKNTKELERIAASMPGFVGGHIGAGDIQGWEKIANFADLTPAFLASIVSEYDIFVTTSTADAQATTILEQMAIGMAVVCTPETGYSYPSIAQLSVSDTKQNVSVLQKVQHAPEEELLQQAEMNRQLVVENHNWDDFCTAVTDFISRAS